MKMSDKENIIISEASLITLGFFSCLSWFIDGNAFALCWSLAFGALFAIFNILLVFYLKWERDEKKKKEKQYQKYFLAYLESQKKENEK